MLALAALRILCMSSSLCQWQKHLFQRFMVLLTLDMLRTLKKYGERYGKYHIVLGQVLFIGGAGGLLVQGTLKELGYEVDLVDLAKVEIQQLYLQLSSISTSHTILDKKLSKKYYK